MATQPLPEDDSDSSGKSLYRMTIDFRMINKVIINEKTSQLPSIKAIENDFNNSIVSTIDLSNCYPSIELEESSRKYFMLRTWYFSIIVWLKVGPLV